MCTGYRKFRGVGLGKCTENFQTYFQISCIHNSIYHLATFSIFYYWIICLELKIITKRQRFGRRKLPFQFPIEYIFCGLEEQFPTNISTTSRAFKLITDTIRSIRNIEEIE